MNSIQPTLCMALSSKHKHAQPPITNTWLDVHSLCFLGWLLFITVTRHNYHGVSRLSPPSLWHPHGY